MNDIAKVEVKRNAAEVQLIQEMYAKNSTKEEFELFMYTANKFGLDPLLKQIWCVKFDKGTAQIYAGRDGFLEIAHRSGAFNGMESGMKDNRTAFAKVYRKDMTMPFYVEVDMAEYSTGKALWGSKPKTMLIKVAESQCLRKAFSISGIYSPEEMAQWELDIQGIQYDTVKAPAITSTSTPVIDNIDTSAENNYGLDPETYKLNGGKFNGKRLIDCDTSYIEWMIGKAKDSKYKQTYDKIPMEIWLSFLEVCLDIHKANKEPKPVEPEVVEETEDDIEAGFERNNML